LRCWHSRRRPAAGHRKSTRAECAQYFAWDYRRLEPRDVIVSAIVDCGGTEFEVHLTLRRATLCNLTPKKCLGLWSRRIRAI